MYNWVPFPFLRITFFFVIGIIACVYIDVDLEIVTLLFIASVTIFVNLIAYLIARKHRFIALNGLVAITLFASVFLMGYAITWMSTPVNEHSHIIHLTNKIVAYTAIVKEQPVEKENSHRILVDITEVKTGEVWQKSEGKIIVYVKKDTLLSKLKYGQKIIVTGNPQEIGAPKNPEEFNYKQYVGFQGIYRQHFIDSEELLIVQEGLGNKIMSYSYEARNWCEQLLKQYVHTPRERAIALALIIGVKDEIDSDINSAYAAAGAMHVLAVSGLHVGVIYWIVSFLFKPYQKRKYGKWVFLAVTLIGLWSYAFVTGLSASVLRAVTMFSFVTIGAVTNRQSNIYNTLSVSAFVLLCYNPYLIMAVGFQLSFLAVFGIVYLQPKIHNLIYVQNKWLDKVWAITSVSIAAQIATAPLVVLYFHQLPSYFFVSNLFVIPGAFVMLCLGLGLFAFNWIPLIGDFVGWLLSKVIWVVNELVFLIREIPHNTIDNIYLSTFQAWCIILIIAALLGLLYFRKMYWMVFMSFAIIGFSSTAIALSRKNINTNEIVFYAVNNAVAIDFIKGNYAYLYTDDELVLNKDKLKFHVAPYRLKKGLPIDYKTLNSASGPIIQRSSGVDLIVWNRRSIAVISPEFIGNYKTKVNVDYIYVPKLSRDVVEQIERNFEYETILVKPYKNLPEYFNDQTKVHDLTIDGALIVKM